MKIIEDKVTVYPPHAICRADVRLIFSSVPSAWTEDIETVRLSAARSAPHTAYFRRYYRTFTIFSRGHTKEHTLHQVLMELAAVGFGVKFASWHRMQAKDVATLQKAVTPFLDELLPKLSQKKIWLDR